MFSKGEVVGGGVGDGVMILIYTCKTNKKINQQKMNKGMDEVHKQRKREKNGKKKCCLGPVLHSMKEIPNSSLNRLFSNDWIVLSVSGSMIGTTMD